MKRKQIKQGDIFYADLNPVKGHEQVGYRPVVVLQNDILNKIFDTVVIAPITSNLKAKNLLMTYFLDNEQSGLKKDSVVLLFQIRTIDMLRLKKKTGIIKKQDFLEMKKQMSLVF